MPRVGKAKRERRRRRRATRRAVLELARARVALALERLRAPTGSVRYTPELVVVGPHTWAPSTSDPIADIRAAVARYTNAGA